jgi:hypothetical protein
LNLNPAKFLSKHSSKTSTNRIKDCNNNSNNDNSRNNSNNDNSHNTNGATAY